MDRIVTIDEALKILQEFKHNGGEFVVISERDLVTGFMNCGRAVSIKFGMDVIRKTDNPIAYAENRFARSLMTEKDKKYKTISFGINKS